MAAPPRVPDRIAQAALARVDSAEAERQRQRVADVTASGKPLVAECDEQRTIRRFSALPGVSPVQAEALAQGAQPAAVGLAGETLRVAEAIQGKTVDFLGVAFLDLARAASSCVGRVISRDGSPIGTGFLISDRLMVTNNHVIGTPEAAAEMLFELNYELGVDGRPRTVTRFAFDAGSFFVTDETDDLDYTVIALGSRDCGTGEVADFGFCPLFDADDKHVLGECVNMAEHPDGDYKQVVVRRNRIVTRLDTVLHYRADTEGGSSGSPVFNDQWEVVALHHWGGPHRQTINAHGQPVQQTVNEGIRISAIVKELLARRDQLDAPKRALLDAALGCSFRMPSRAAIVSAVVTPPTVVAKESRDIPVPPGGREPNGTRGATATATPALAPTLNSDGSATFTIPIEISVRIPLGTRGAPPAGGAAVERGAEATPQPDSDYASRSGYDPEFLPGVPVPLPKVTDEAPGSPAPVNGAPADSPYELKYEHFSIVMNRDRKMAFVAAANIDGAQLRKILRKTGKLSDGGAAGTHNLPGDTEKPEATEKWWPDPRIGPDAQTDQALYDHQSFRCFDRGHQCRREDPVWGADGEAERANADTFHFTNCCPQEWQFNEQAKYWGGIEAYVLENARMEHTRVCVFTGPVFSATDPEYRSVQVPLQFFKVVAWVAGGRLRATALLRSQAERLTSLPERLAGAALPEAFDDVGKVRDYLTTIAHLEQLTGLDFGPLREADTNGGESLSRTARPMTGWPSLGRVPV